MQVLELEGLKFTALPNRVLLQGPDHTRLPYALTWAAAMRLRDWLSVEIGKHTDWAPIGFSRCVQVDLSPEALTAAVWNGEGLPPVGCVCEVQDADGDWHKCRVIAHHLSNAVFVPDAGYPYGCYDGLPADRFRPLRTAEQLAAEAREKAVDEMVERFALGDRDGVPWRDLFDQMYVAGYLKPNA